MTQIKKVLFSFLLCSVFIPVSHAKGGYLGLYGGVGAPYLFQGGLTYVLPSAKLSLDLKYSVTDATSGTTSIEASKPELNLKWHPMGGAFYIGTGIGSMSLTANAIEPTTGESAKVEIDATTLTPNIGWMWGISDGGFMIGMELGYQLPLSSESKVTTALPTTNGIYQQAVKDAEDLGDTNIPVLTLLRLGYLF